MGLGLGLGGAALIEKAKEHRGGSSSSTEHTTEPKPAPTTTVQPAPSSTTAQPAPSSATQATPTTTAQAAPTTTTQAASAPSKKGTLAQTGANVTALAMAGSLVIIAGAAFLIAGRRKENES